MSSSRLCWPLFVTLLLLGNAAVAEQADLEMVRQQVEAVLDSLPAWDPEVLTVEDGEDWIAQVTFEQVYHAVGDKPPSVVRLPDGATLLEGSDRVVQIEREAGGVRYISRARAWSYEADVDTEPIEKSAARRLVEDSLARLGVPQDEISGGEVATQVGAGAPAGVSSPRGQFAFYRLVTFWREIAGLYVEGSRIRAAVSNRGEIQRLRVAWPIFRLQPNLAFREPEAVVQEAVQQIMARSPEDTIRIRGRQAFVALAEGDKDPREARFAPSVILSVLSSPTPYLFAVPVAEPEVVR